MIYKMKNKIKTILIDFHHLFILLNLKLNKMKKIYSIMKIKNINNLYQSWFKKYVNKMKIIKNYIYQNLKIKIR
jgi:hypothetical protein